MDGHRVNFIGNTCVERYATVNVNPDVTDFESTVLSFVHELAHANMWMYKIDQEIYIDNSQPFGGVWHDLFGGYSESFAITTQYLIRDELGQYNPSYMESPANMYHIENGFYCYSEQKDGNNYKVKYGAFPNTLAKSAHMKLIYTHRLDLFYKMYSR